MSDSRARQAGTVTLDDIRSRGTITVPEAAKFLGIGRESAYAAARRGDLPVLRFSGRVVVSVPRLLAMLGATEGPS